MKDIMVSIVCLTYNHARYIRDCLDGFLKQKTEYPFEIVIHDDASTDGTAEIIKEYEANYPAIVVPIYQSQNQFKLKKIFPQIVFPKLRGKYIAICDGDDYWIDEYKLQKQTAFMEKHQECSMIFHGGFEEAADNSYRREISTFKESGFYSQEENILAGLGTNFPISSSMLWRKKVMLEAPEFFLFPKAIDYSIRQLCASKGEIYYLDEIMSVYRTGTAESFMKETEKNVQFYKDYVLEMLYFFEKYNEYTDYKYRKILEKKIISDYYGLCCVVREEDFKNLKSTKYIDVNKVKKYFQKIQQAYLDESILKLYQSVDEVYIYGTSKLAKVCAKQLEYRNLQYNGFVVSDGQRKKDIFCEKKVYFLGEIEKKNCKVGFIMAVQPVNLDIILQNFKGKEHITWCEPFSV